MKNLSVYLCLFLAASIQVEAGLTPPSSNRDAIDDFNREESPSRTSRLLTEKQEPVQLQDDESNCEKLSDSCISCLNLGHCKFTMLNNTQTVCNDTGIDDKVIMAGFPGLDYDEILKNAADCPAENGDDDVSTVKPKFDTSLTPENQTTSSTTESTTQTSTTTGSTTPTSSSSSSTSTTSASSTTSTTTATSTATSTTTATSSTTATPTTTQATPSTTPVDPSGKSGSKFDGWSFFGGILLTIGLSAIGFISFKYYKVRTAGQAGGANYNRF